MEKIGILGVGAMGSGIAQVAAAAGHEVIMFDVHSPAMSRCEDEITLSTCARCMNRLSVDVWR